MSRILGTVAATVLVAATTLAPTAAAASRPDVVLSNETTNTTFAVATRIVPIRTQPTTHSRTLSKLRWQTPDGEAVQTYLLLREHWTSTGAWIKLRVPMRPNGRVGWVPRGALDTFQHVNTELIVNRATHQLTLYRGGNAIFHAPVGVGKPGTPTPAGHFWISEAFRSTDPFYGPYAFGTTDYATLSEWPGGGIVGLHGTNEPALVPGDPSHGCIRLHNGDVVKLESLLPIGTPLWVQ